MQIPVEIQYANGTKKNVNYTLTNLALIKHLAIAGQGYSPKLQKTFRTIGMFLHYMFYLKSSSLNKNCFSQPPSDLSDPTEKNQFSNIVGKAIADFLSKKIDNSIMTVNYEAAMRKKGFKIKGKRPDLIAYSKTRSFAIEAKGRDSAYVNMNSFKQQSQTGPISVNFSIACISYNLYSSIKCNYYDPVNNNAEYDTTLLSDISKDYYKGFLDFLNTNFFNVTEIEFLGEKFYKLQINFNKIGTLYNEFSYPWFCIYETLHLLRPALLITKKIQDFAENGITRDIIPFPQFEEGSIYIDSDRIGLMLT